jgi:hypothetical protein
MLPSTVAAAGAIVRSDGTVVVVAATNSPASLFCLAPNASSASSAFASAGDGVRDADSGGRPTKVRRGEDGSRIEGGRGRGGCSLGASFMRGRGLNCAATVSADEAMCTLGSKVGSGNGDSVGGSGAVIYERGSAAVLGRVIGITVLPTQTPNMAGAGDVVEVIVASTNAAVGGEATVVLESILLQHVDQAKRGSVTSPKQSPTAKSNWLLTVATGCNYAHWPLETPSSRTSAMTSSISGPSVLVVKVADSSSTGDHSTAARALRPRNTAALTLCQGLYRWLFGVSVCV